MRDNDLSVKKYEPQELFYTATVSGKPPPEHPEWLMPASGLKAFIEKHPDMRAEDYYSYAQIKHDAQFPKRKDELTEYASIVRVYLVHGHAKANTEEGPGGGEQVYARYENPITRELEAILVPTGKKIKLN